MQCVSSTVGGAQYHGGCSVLWGYREYHRVFSTLGDIMINVGRYLEYRGGVQYRGGFHEYHGVILSIMGDTQYRGGYSVLWGSS